MSATDDDIANLCTRFRGPQYPPSAHRAADMLESLLARAKAAELACDEARGQFDNHVIWAAGAAQGLEAELIAAQAIIETLKTANDRASQILDISRDVYALMGPMRLMTAMQLARKELRSSRTDGGA